MNKKQTIKLFTITLLIFLVVFLAISKQTRSRVYADEEKKQEVFYDNFDSEPDANCRSNQNFLNYWNIFNLDNGVPGNIDLIGYKSDETLCGNPPLLPPYYGKQIDVEGSDYKWTRVTTKYPISILPGRYNLMIFAGRSGSGVTDNFNVYVSDADSIKLLEKNYIMAPNTGISLRSEIFDVCRATDASISMGDTGTSARDNYGTIVESVALQQTSSMQVPASLLNEIDTDPNYVIAGVPVNFSVKGIDGNGNPFNLSSDWTVTWTVTRGSDSWNIPSNYAFPTVGSYQVNSKVTHNTCNPAFEITENNTLYLTVLKGVQDPIPSPSATPTEDPKQER